MNDPGPDSSAALADTLADSLSDTLAEIASALRDDATLVRAVASGRRRNTVVPYRRVELRYVDLTDGRRLQVTAYDDRQAHTRNVDPGQLDRELDALLQTAYSSWHVDTTTETVQLRVTKKGRPVFHRAPKNQPVEPDRRHDRTKRRRFDAADPLFAALGMTTTDGDILPSKMAKFRQVQDLLAVLEPVVDAAVPSATPEPRPVRVVDLGCGNAYLTFAAVRYLTEVRGLAVRALGVDAKAQSRAHGADIADRLGMAGEVEFVAGDIVDAPVLDIPDLVLALHACDTATDDALARAVRWQSAVVVAAPCCHHDLQRQLAAAGGGPERYRLVTRHGILSERLADVLTDAFRAAILRIVGYRVDVMEFVDSRHTPRNAVIRAVRTGAEPSEATVAAYRALVEEWNVVPSLARQLVDLHPVLAAGTA